MSKFFVFVFVFFLFIGVFSVCVGQLVSDTSIISLSGKDWSLKVDGVLQSSLDSRNTPYTVSKSVSEKELFLELESFEDCKSGVVQFKVDMLGLTAYKQLPLTQQEINQGLVRPKNVENSFALFDSEGKKVAHIYGSKITDSKGLEVWVDQDLSEGLLTVYLPKPEVLETLSFPLLLDPTFGYSDVGASGDQLLNLISGLYGYVEGYGSEATSISVYLVGWENGENVSCAIYSQGKNLIQATETRIDGGADGWYNFTFSTPVLLADANYYINCFADSSIGYKFDEGTSFYMLYRASYTYGNFPASFTEDVLGTNFGMSIYLNYQLIESPTPSPSPSPSSTLTPITSGELNNSMLFVLGFMVVMCVVGLVLFGKVPVVVLLIGLFTILVGLYCGLGGVYSLGAAQGWFSLFVALFGGLTMLLVGLGVRVRR